MYIWPCHGNRRFSMVTITRTSEVLVHVLAGVLPSSPAICRRSQKKFTKCGSMTVLPAYRDGDSLSRRFFLI